MMGQTGTRTRTGRRTDAAKQNRSRHRQTPIDCRADRGIERWTQTDRQRQTGKERGQTERQTNTDMYRQMHTDGQMTDR
uniref:Uncharacterized protein n=1 Tax=Haemonchus contortus TaxID=6289 RepID=A0A7I4YGU8_HAECO